MRIGELAKRTGTTTRALRFYEDQGLLAARRAANGYREYDEDDLQLVTEILKLQTVGLSLDETRPFVECLRSGHETGDSCASSIEMYRRKLAEADAVLARLGAIRAELAGKLADALARQDPAGAPDPCVVPERL
ncbi:MerR family transcriptional regulator [Amycolatopsis sp., V23-08]|uniref:MerR family transcriptional regulator n=1 Tax=Amycolatopsis heterodermiae TaxID=3110235 RepID=A0ABU5R5G8_9PSEU|nr:MerR family transcriptional regulator [Amycolatopsis sp., V23-08]MEA5361413.1 MerR family transcriptional regulator [Amycolatopsis sp., V23-08]